MDLSSIGAWRAEVVLAAHGRWSRWRFELENPGHGWTILEYPRSLAGQEELN